MKRIISLVCGCLILVIIAFPFFSVSKNSASEIFEVIEQQFNTSDISNGVESVPNYVDGYQQQLKERMGEELYIEYLEADPASWLEEDPTTGELKIVTPNVPDWVDLSTEPYIPEEVEIADEFISSQNLYTSSEIEYPVSNSYPYCTNAFLEITFQDGSTGTASGVFVKDDVVLTAGHNIYQHGLGYATQVLVTPSGIPSKFETSTKKSLQTTLGWERDKNRNYDYGVIKLNKSLGTGYLGMKNTSDSYLNNITLLGIYGFPGNVSRGLLWYSSGSLTDFDNEIIYHDAISYRGNSGSPVVDMADYKNVIGIHILDTNLGYAAVRMRNPIIEFVNKYGK